VGAIGATGTTAANALAAGADVVIGIGTRWSDFTTASRSVFAAPDVQFVNINVTAFDAAKHAGIAVVADARAALEALLAETDGWSASAGYRSQAAELAAQWSAAVDQAYGARHVPLPAQAEVIGAVNEACENGGIVLTTAGSMPGHLHKLWRARDPRGYHVEYGYSCMGYEIAGGLGAKLAAPDREVFVLVGDGSYLMMAQELVTAVQEGIKLVVVCVDKHGFASIGGLSESVGSQRFGTSYRYRGPTGGSTATISRSTWPPTPKAWAWRRCGPQRPTSSAWPWRRPSPRREPFWSTSRPIRLSSRRRAARGGTSRWPRPPRSRPRVARALFMKWPNGSSALICDLPPASVGAWRHMRAWSYVSVQDSHTEGGLTCR
jgi:hypothetical protein